MGMGCVLGVGHAVDSPEGYTKLRESTKATLVQPAKLGRFTWKEWKGEGGRRVGMDVVAYSHRRTAQDLEFDVDFRLHFDEQGQPRTMDCSTGPVGGSHGKGAVRLRCTVEGEGATVVYQIASGLDRCAGLNLHASDEPEVRDCWQGQLTTANEAYTVEFAFTEKWNSPVARIVWRNSKGQAVQSSDFTGPAGAAPLLTVSGGAPERHDKADPLRRSLLIHAHSELGADADVLLANAVAVHAWFQMLSNANQHDTRATRQL